MSNERRIMDDEIVVGLRKARALIESERQWACGRIRRFRRGTTVARCAGAAIIDATGGEFHRFRVLLSYLETALPRTLRVFGLVSYNDTHTHAEVLALFDRAIAMRFEELGCQSAAPTT